MNGWGVSTELYWSYQGMYSLNISRGGESDVLNFFPRLRIIYVIPENKEKWNNLLMTLYDSNNGFDCYVHFKRPVKQTVLGFRCL